MAAQVRFTIPTKPRGTAFRSPWLAQTFLVGLALEESDAAVVERALHLAAPARAEVHLAHAFAPGGASGAEGVEAQRSEFLARLAVQAERLGAAGAEGLHVEPGTPHRLLLELGRRIGADLLIVGAGSVAERLIASGWANVLVVARDRRAAPGLEAPLPAAVGGLFLG